MKKITGLFIVWLSLMGVQSAALAEAPLDAKRIYVGGGLAFNSMPAVGSALGYQFFAGYELNLLFNNDVTSALELGYTSSGDFEQLATAPKADAAKGFWLAGIDKISITDNVDLLARLGYDFGDDDGFLLGAGVQYKVVPKVAVRMEYVARQHYDGLQANVLFRF